MPIGLQAIRQPDISVQPTRQTHAMATANHQNFPLLSLPGEIRIQIYSYALTSSATLHYRGSAPGTALQTPETGQSDLQATPKLIFKEAYEDGSNALQSFSQLKNTCQLLKDETENFELKYNNVEITADTSYWHIATSFRRRMIPEQPSSSAKMRLGFLLRHIRPERISWLRKIIIRNDFEFVEAYRNLTAMTRDDYTNTDFVNHLVRDSIPDLDAVCQAYPGVPVRYICPAFHSVASQYRC
jgi:hypothetical protein